MSFWTWLRSKFSGNVAYQAQPPAISNIFNHANYTNTISQSPYIHGNATLNKAVAVAQILSADGNTILDAAVPATPTVNQVVGNSPPQIQQTISAFQQTQFAGNIAI